MRYQMGDEKIEQNIDRVYHYLHDYLFSTLGLDEYHPEDAIKILNGVIKKIEKFASQK